MVKVAHADARQTHVHAFLPDIVEQLERYGHKDILVVGGVGQAALCRASAAIRVLELERYGSARQPLTAQAAPNRLAEQRNRRLDIPTLSQILRKGAFIADRLDLALFIEARDFGEFESQRTLRMRSPLMPKIEAKVDFGARDSSPSV